VVHHVALDTLAGLAKPWNETWMIRLFFHHVEIIQLNVFFFRLHNATHTLQQLKTNYMFHYVCKSNYLLIASSDESIVINL
jgi:hypothetical protein